MNYFKGFDENGNVYKVPGSAEGITQIIGAEDAPKLARLMMDSLSPREKISVIINSAADLTDGEKESIARELGIHPQSLSMIITAIHGLDDRLSEIRDAIK